MKIPIVAKASLFLLVTLKSQRIMPQWDNGLFSRRFPNGFTLRVNTFNFKFFSFIQYLIFYIYIYIFITKCEYYIPEMARPQQIIFYPTTTIKALNDSFVECRSWIFWRIFWFQICFGISSFFSLCAFAGVDIDVFFMSKYHATKLTLSIQLKSRFLWPQLWYRHAYCADTNNFIISFIIMTYSFIEIKLEANRIIYKWMNECFDSKSNDCPCVLLMRHRCASSDTDFVMVLFCEFYELFIF